MSWVTDAFIEKWHSGRALGADAPRIVVEVRRGSYRRDYRAWASPGVLASIPGETREEPWYPIFTETTPWVEMPNIRSVQQVRALDSNGCKVATIQFDNVGYVALTGPGGDDYHTIQRGFYSPDRGYTPPTRPASGLTPNDWANVLTKNANVRVWQGFGEPEREFDGSMPEDGGSNGTWTFNGLIDDVDLQATPVSGQLVVRMGKTLTDGRVFGWNKSKQLPDPIIFADRQSLDQITLEGYKPLASSFRGDSYHSSNVLDAESLDTSWISDASVTPSFTEWVQLKLPAGRYSDIRLHCPAGMELYIGIYPKDQLEVDPMTGGTFAASPRRDGAEIPSGEWYSGIGTVPGDNGGWEYVKLTTTLSGIHTVDLDAEYEVGKGTILRLGFRDLADDALTGGVYSAQVETFHARRRDEHRTKESRLWILVDDISDMVRVVCRWAGYQEWEIEDTGVRLKGKYVVNRTSFLIDPIKRACEQTGFVFFVADPDDGSSIGIPTFRRPAALIRDPAIIAAEIRDTNLIGNFQTKASEESLPYIIRVRGKEASASSGGVALGGDRVRRIMFVYRPPWTEDNEMAGIIKHIVKYDPALKTDDEVKMACYLIAAAAAVAAYTAQVVVPGFPLLELDDQLGVMDTATGTNSRMWITSLDDTFTRSKDDTSWRTTASGNLLDTQDLVDVIDAILAEDFGDAGIPVVISSEPQPRTR